MVKPPQGILLRYPSNLNELYGSDQVNIIKFYATSYDNTKVTRFKSTQEIHILTLGAH